MSEARRQIGVDQPGLGSVLRQNLLVVPPNQREYAWTEKEVEQLFTDFARAISEGQEYFLGSIVTIPRTNGTLEVVDGQQRLATTAILLAAIRDYLRDKGEKLLVESITEFLTGIDRVRLERVSKLKLNIDDNELFHHIVAGEPGETAPAVTRASHRLLLRAYQLAQRHVLAVVASLASRDHAGVLNSWVTFIEYQALVVLLRVPDDADAFRMFETLNDRGLRTSQADLIKNYLFARSGGRISEVQGRWAYMRGALESYDEDIVIDFLRHAMIVLRGHTREADVYEAVQDRVKNESSAVAFASVLENLAAIYVATFNPEHERWNGYPDSVRRSIEVFKLLNIRPFQPLILAVGDRLDANETARAFRFLVSLGVRLLIASTTRSGSTEIPLATAAHQVYEGTISTTAQLRAALENITPTDKEFSDAFETARVSTARFARYYLRSLEMTAKGEQEPWFMPMDDKSVINLEHVLPLKPEGNWPQFSDEEVDTLSSRLGNLALMRASDNSDLKSLGFAEKKVVFGASPYILTSQIADSDEWTAATILARQKTLAGLAAKTWPIK